MTLAVISSPPRSFSSDFNVLSAHRRVRFAFAVFSTMIDSPINLDLLNLPSGHPSNPGQQQAHSNGHINGRLSVLSAHCLRPCT